jgi:ferritin-like metal-binding protein YciE
MAKLNSLKDLFENQLRVLYYSEKQFLSIVSQVVEKVSSDELKNSIQKHRSDTQSQIERLEKVFKNLKLEVKTENCTAMNGIVDEIKEVMNEDADPAVIDAAIIAELQKGIHFKIACYGTLRTYAGVLGYGEIEDLMKETLHEEKNSDKEFTEIAEGVNQEAV